MTVSALVCNVCGREESGKKWTNQRKRIEQIFSFKSVGTSSALRARLRKKPTTTVATTATRAKMTIRAVAHCGRALDAASSAALSC